MIFFTIKLVIRIAKSRKNSRKRNLTRNKKSVMSKDTKFAVTSVAMNINFLFLNMPMTLITILVEINVISNLSELDDRLGHAFMTQLTFINAGSIFLINLISNSIFRSEFIETVVTYLPVGIINSSKVMNEASQRTLRSNI